MTIFAAGRPPTAGEFDDASMHLVGWGRRLTTSTATSGTTARAVLLLEDIPTRAGNGYWVVTNSLTITSSVANDRGSARISYQDSGADATTADSMLCIMNTVAMPSTTDGQSGALSGLYVAPADGKLSVLLYALRLAGTGGVTIVGHAGGMDLMVYNIGPMPADTGQDQ